MNKDQVMARQAQEIYQLTDRVEHLTASINQARLHIIGIGGPLNDNLLGYTPKQLVVFQRILNELDA